jgi:oligosaccharide 4-alpha-D-glucosyltransferase
MVDAVNNTEDYSSEKLQLHYYADQSITHSSAQMYEDDGKSFDAIESGKFEVLEFQSEQNERELAIEVSRKGGNYDGMPEQRDLEFVIHNMATAPTKIMFAGKLIAVTGYSYSSKSKKLVVSVKWDHSPKELRVIL